MTMRGKSELLSALV